MNRDLIPEVLSHAFRPRSEGGLGRRLVDIDGTARNEEMVADAINAGLGGAGNGGDAVHVMIKVRYTHLGYNRTCLSVLESMERLRNLEETNRNIKVHVLLHWPRCYDNVSWMDCKGEEERLPQYVKEIGPPPHLNRYSSWGPSWRALEDLYTGSYPSKKGAMCTLPSMSIESIGVSNFELDDMEGLIAGARIKPHIYQGNPWVALNERGIMSILHDNSIHFQVYNIISGCLGNTERAPNAYRQLERIGQDLYEHAVASPGESTVETQPPFSAGTVLLAFLVQSAISVVLVVDLADKILFDSVMDVPIMPDPLFFGVQQCALALIVEEVSDPSRNTDSEGMGVGNGLQSVMSVSWIHSQTDKEILQHTESLLRRRNYSPKPILDTGSMCRAM